MLRLLNFLLSGLLLMTAGCATTTPGAPGGAIDVIAHRGASAYAPENTLAAFQLAADMQADWFELDCHLSQDGEVIVIHDGDLKRTTGVEGTVAGMDSAHLTKLSAGGWFDPKFADELLPTLTQSLEVAKGKIGVYVEIKNAQDDSALIQQLMQLPQPKDIGATSDMRRAQMMPLVEANATRNLALTRAVIEDIRRLGMEEQVVIQSFSPIVCLVALAEAPEMRTELLATREKDHPERFEQVMAFGWRIDPAGFNLSHHTVTPEFIQQAHAAGKTVAVWTVDEPEMMTRLQGWGVDAIITNKPDVARQVLGRSE